MDQSGQASAGFDGNVLVTGYISGFCQAIDDDLVVYMLSPDGRQLLYMSVMGGRVGEYARSIAVSASGYAYVTANLLGRLSHHCHGLSVHDAGNVSCAQFATINVSDCADAYLVVLNENGQRPGSRTQRHRSKPD